MRWIFVVLAALGVFIATSAWGQSIPSPPSGKPTAADEATAKKNFESGLKLYGEGSFGEALVAFEQSYRVGGRPSALKNVAQCHRNLKHFVEAHEAYEALLERHEAQLPAADKTAVKQALDELGVLTGTILVTVNEEGADIEIDGKPIAKSPMSKPKRVAVGSHAVRVTRPTFATNEQQVAIASQEAKKVDVKLEPEKTTGRIVVREQSGRDVHVFVDGADQGPAPWEGEVTAGDHTVEAKSARYASELRRIKVTAKERLDIALDATPLTGHLRVTTIPASAAIKIDGTPVGSGAWEGDLPEGTHRIEVGMSGSPPQVRDIAIARGQLLVQEIPVVAAIAGAIAEYPGLYGQLSLSGMFGFAGGEDNSNPNADGSSSSVRSQGHFIFGATAAVRVGYAFDWYGAEGVAIFMPETRSHDYEYASAPPNNFTGNFVDRSFSPNGFFGAGGRVTSKHETVRFTFGLAPGIAIRSFNPSRECEGSCNHDAQSQSPSGTTSFIQNEQNNDFSSSGNNRPNHVEFPKAGYTAFALVLDAGVYFGSTPGAKFFLGVQSWIDFPPDTIVTGPDTQIPLTDNAYKHPGRGIRFIDGPQFYIGPSIGLRFGH
jgi:hypothetical protein